MVSSYRNWVSFDIASHDHHASDINTRASPVPSMQLPNPWTLSSTPRRVLWTIASHTFLRRVPTIVHTQKKWTTVYLIHPASQRPPPPASQCCIPATIAYTSPLTSQRLLAPKEWPKGRLVHPTSSPSTRRSQQRPMPTHRPATFHHPTSGQWTVSHIRHRFRAIVGICISTSRPGNYHIYVSVSLPSLR